MPFSQEDTRKVQTAVFGHVGSDLPVFLPMDADDFGTFIRNHPERTFFCGTLLGGCGKKLAPKQYRDRKCHFAHVSDAANCRRTEGDESSADHLYIGRAVADWLKRQRQRADQPAYRPKGHQVRDVVDVSCEAGRRLIRVQLARRSKREWEEADAELRARYTGLDWLFGPDSLLANWQVERQGYALRVQCRSAGATREVEIGTQFPDRPVDWTSLSECTLEREGIVTPSLLHTPDGIVPRHAATTQADTPPSCLPLTPASVLITDATLSHVTGTHLWFDVSVRVNARLALPVNADAPDAQSAYLPMDATLSLDGDGTWLIEASALQRIQTDTPDRTTDSAAPSSDTHDPSPEEQRSLPDADLVTSFRKTLENTARSKNIVTMATLCRGASLPVHTLSVARWRDLLLQVEQPWTPGKPVLSALIKGRDGGPAPFFGEILHGLGWTKGFSDAKLLDIWNRERGRVHAAYCRSGQANPPSLPRPETRREPPGRVGGKRTDSVAARRRAAFDALLDVAQEARQAGDLDTFEQNLFLAERAAQSTDDQETLRDHTDWLVDRRADELYETWERLSALIDTINRDGDDLLPDQLRRAVRSAEELAVELGDDLAAEERRDIARWRQHLERMADRLTLPQIRGHAVAVRVALRQAAREGRTTTWGELALRIGSPLAALHPDDKTAVLVEADRETPDERPPLSALVTAHGGDRPHPLYLQILFNLDRIAPPPDALFMHWRMALRRHSELR
ncbi:competence protein CoiA family protein [Streptomyces deccanensis]|uniref:competence protein CoiA family protein n=1 Tax=Streptomyces deccanensis TaxID=424188 RepID=UPI001EFC0C1E|nr:competence protein CoiA family protein [Streptomyces deccanensis]ULR54663.1 competence protein CoiA [Streptomyces deccanensis]